MAKFALENIYRIFLTPLVAQDFWPLLMGRLIFQKIQMAD